MREIEIEFQNRAMIKKDKGKLMRGNITRRGKASWRLKFDLGTDPATGKRQTQFVTMRGTKKEAEAELQAAQSGRRRHVRREDRRDGRASTPAIGWRPSPRQRRRQRRASATLRL